MTTTLDNLRLEARNLRRAYRRGEAAALHRVRAVLGSKSDIRHADILHVIAREEGHDSWPRLKAALDAAAMNRAARAERLKYALYFGQSYVAEALLASDPDLADADLGLAIATYDLASVRAAVANDPQAATRIIGVRSPILHLAFSHYHRMRPDLRPDMLAIAALLVANGADVNDAYRAEPEEDYQLSAIYGALGHAGNLALAEWLLEHGANPNDNESLYHATELGHREGLRLLLKHGADPAGTNALARALDFDDLEAVRMLLEAGADPDEAVHDHPSGEPVYTVPALHQAARRWRSGETVALLLDHGADPARIWQGLTPYATARVYGNADAARVLEARGYAIPLSPDAASLAAIADGHPPHTRLDPTHLDPELRRLGVRIAGNPDRLDHLRGLMLAGLDPDETDEMGLTALHIAGWEGLPDHVAFLLTLGPDLAYRNRYGGDALGTVIHGAEFSPQRANRDHVSCARLLLDAGAILDPQSAAGTGSPDMAAFLEDWLAGEQLA